MSIIILSYNTKDLLKQCLMSIVDSLQLTADGSRLATEIIVVDNASVDGSVQEVKNLKFDIENSLPCKGLKIKNLKLKIIENDQNYGFAKGNNQGLKEAKGAYVMLLNSDTIVKEDSLVKLVNFLNDHQEIDVVGPKLLNNDGTPQANCGRFPSLWVSFVMLFKEHFGGSDIVRRSPKESKVVDWLMGAAFVARKKVFNAIGGLDENIFMYMEEIEWFYRVRKAGFKTYFFKDSEIIHLGRGSSKSGKREPILNIYKGLIYFYKKHKTFPELLILKTLLKLKAAVSIFIGYVKNDLYLKETYGEAIKIN